MAKFEVTPELANTIKSTRVQNNVSAKSLAEYLGKSQSYISKLEKAEIKSIEESLLTSLFKYIFLSKEGGQVPLEEMLEKIYNTISLKYTDEEINRQVWFDNYDTVMRLLPIPAALVDDLKRRMDAIGLSPQILLQKINANEDISPEVKNTDKYPFNEWQAYVVDHSIKFIFIKIKISDEEFNNILEQKTQKSNYIYLYSIAYYLSKIETFGDRRTLNNDEIRALHASVRKYLNSYKFYSISEKSRIIESAKSADEIDNLLTSFDIENKKYVSQIVHSFQLYSEMDIQFSNTRLEKLANNLDWDTGFMIALMSLPYNELKELSISKRQEFLLELRDLLKKYRALQTNQRQIEIYDVND